MKPFVEILEFMTTYFRCSDLFSEIIYITVNNCYWFGSKCLW